MADNTQLNVGTGGDLIASDDIAGVKHQRVKVEFGADGSATDVSSASPLPVTVSGTVSIAANGVISTVNSTAVALGIGGVFTGTSEDSTEFSDVRVSVFSDQASAVDGLQMQQSSNGTNWDNIDSYSVPAGTGKIFSVGVSARFFRIAYTNGAVAQTAFRLQAKYHKTYSKGSSVRPQDARTNDNDFEEVLGYGMVYNGTSWDRMRGDATNGLRMQKTPTTQWVTATAASGTITTATLPAAGAGLVHYITTISLHLYATAARTGVAAPLLVTTTNLPGSPVWTFSTGQLIGVVDRYDVPINEPIKSSVANTATTFVAPVATSGIWRLNIGYYAAP